MVSPSYAKWPPLFPCQIWDEQKRGSSKVKSSLKRQKTCWRCASKSSPPNQIGALKHSNCWMAFVNNRLNSSAPWFWNAMFWTVNRIQFSTRHSFKMRQSFWWLPMLMNKWLFISIGSLQNDCLIVFWKWNFRVLAHLKGIFRLMAIVIVLCLLVSDASSFEWNFQDFFPTNSIVS